MANWNITNAAGWRFRGVFRGGGLGTGAPLNSAKIGLYTGGVCLNLNILTSGILFCDVWKVPWRFFGHYSAL